MLPHNLIPKVNAILDLQLKQLSHAISLCSCVHMYTYIVYPLIQYVDVWCSWAWVNAHLTKHFRFKFTYVHACAYTRTFIHIHHASLFLVYIMYMYVGDHFKAV